VDGGSVRQAIAFTPITVAYSVTFDQSGAPLGAAWYLNVSGEPSARSNSTTATIDLPNGTYSFSIASSNKDYAPSPAIGNFTVAGEALSGSVAFAPVLFTVIFTETGGTFASSWSVTLGGTTESSATSAIDFSETNGTYAYSVGVEPGYIASPGSGTVAVKGSSSAEGIRFTAFTAVYPVTFAETGLPTGANWWVTLNGTRGQSTTSSVVFSEMNGTYPYTVGTTTRYLTSPVSGTIDVNGSGVDRGVTFSPPPTMYSVTFTESGLPSGTSWTVSLNGTPFSLASRVATFTEPNGTYPFTVSAVANYSANPASGSVTVNGADLGRTITFSPIPPAPSNGSAAPTFLGMPALDGYVFVGEVAAAAAVGIAALVLLPRWGRTSPGSEPPASGPGTGHPPVP